MLDRMSPVSFAGHITVDERNKRLIVDGYARETNPYLLGRQLIDLAVEQKLEKIWLWALPEDVPEFLRGGFSTEGNIFRGSFEEFTVSLAYFVSAERGHSLKLSIENDIIRSVRMESIKQSHSLPLGMEMKLLNESFTWQISHVLSEVFTSYPTPVDDPQYIASLMQKGNIFAGTFFQQKLIGVAAAYPDPVFKRCEMTDCAIIKEYRGQSLSEQLLIILEHEVCKRGSFNLYTLARAQSFGMNRVFHKLGYQYQGRLINNCHIGGSFEDMNLWVK